MLVVVVVVVVVDNKIAGGITTNWNHWDSAYLRQDTSYRCRDTDPNSDTLTRIATNWAIANLSSKFRANPFGSFFCAKFLTDKPNIQTDRQTNNNDYISSLAEVITEKKYLVD